MPIGTQLVISVADKPGTLAHVVAVLGNAGVNIKAFHAPELRRQIPKGPGQLRVIVADLGRARTALKAGKIKFREESALVLSLENRPGALQLVTDLLGAAKINITCGYCTPSREGKKAIVVLTVSNTQKALNALRGKSLDAF